MSVNTRELVVEEGGFVYDSDYYGDDLPYWTRITQKPHLVIPYAMVVNDACLHGGNEFGSPNHFFEMAKANFDRLRNDGDDVNRMMSIGLHPRISGTPGRADGLALFIEYVRSIGQGWFACRLDLANTFIEQQPSDSGREQSRKRRPLERRHQ